MKVLAFLVAASAWAAFLFAPKSTPSRMLQFVVFGLLGALLTLAGGFSYWWDSGMRPTHRSAFILVCGIVTLVSQAATFLVGVFDQEGGMSWPDRDSRRR